MHVHIDVHYIEDTIPDMHLNKKKNSVSNFC